MMPLHDGIPPGPIAVIAQLIFCRPGTMPRFARYVPSFPGGNARTIFTGLRATVFVPDIPPNQEDQTRAITLSYWATPVQKPARCCISAQLGRYSFGQPGFNPGGAVPRDQPFGVTPETPGVPHLRGPGAGRGFRVVRRGASSPPGPGSALVQLGAGEVHLRQLVGADDDGAGLVHRAAGLRPAGADVIAVLDTRRQRRRRVLTQLALLRRRLPVQPEVGVAGTRTTMAVLFTAGAGAVGCVTVGPGSSSSSGTRRPTGWCRRSSSSGSCSRRGRSSRGRPRPTGGPPS